MMNREKKVKSSGYFAWNFVNKNYYGLFWNLTLIKAWTDVENNFIRSNFVRNKIYIF